MTDHKLTPREPSPEMVKAAARECNDISFNRIAEQGLDGDDFRAIWRAMHDAAPQPAALPELSDAEIGRLVDRMDNTHDSDLLKFARAVIAAMKGKQ